MFDNTQEFINYCIENNKTVAEASLEREIHSGSLNKEAILANLEEILSIMESSSSYCLDKDIQSMGNLIGKEARLLENYRKNNTSLSGDFIISAAARALSTSQVNASMGKIVAAPTAGAAGILPAVLFAYKEKFNCDNSTLIRGLLTSSFVGEVIAKKASISGAEGGCQAECGSAASMAAAALVEMQNGSVNQVFDAASFALINIMGLVCDPVAGLVEYPCNIRNASGVTNAYLSADMSLAGITSIIPFDEVVESMDQVGRLMHSSLRETALGGIASTRTGNKIKKSLNIK